MAEKKATAKTNKNKPKYMREIQIRCKKKRVAANAPVDVMLTDAKQVAELFRDMQRETKEKMVL